jgi:hypothetical protein
MTCPVMGWDDHGLAMRWAFTVLGLHWMDMFWGIYGLCMGWPMICHGLGCPQYGLAMARAGHELT